MKTAMIVLSLILLGTGLGCVSLSKFLTPARVDQEAVRYVVRAGVAEPNNFIGYPNLLKAEELVSGVDAAHDSIQLKLQHLIEQDNLEYAIHRDVVATNFTNASQVEERLFGEEGLLSLGLSLVGFGTFTGVIGLMRKRPGDVTQAEMEQVVADATGKTTEELTEKQKQFVQVVKGVQELIKELKASSPDVNFKATDILEHMGTIFNKHQDSTTRTAVTAAKVA